MLNNIGTKNQGMMTLNQYRPHPFESITTHQKSFKEFKFKAKSKVDTRAAEVVKSKALSTHFDTSNKKDYV